MAKYIIRSINDNWGGVLVIDLSKTSDTDYVKGIANRLKNNACLVLFNQSGIIRTANTITKTGTGVTVNHYFMDANSHLIKHNHKFYFDGTYNLSVVTYDFNEEIIKELQTKLNNITTNE